MKNIFGFIILTQKELEEKIKLAENASFKKGKNFAAKEFADRKTRLKRALDAFPDKEAYEKASYSAAKQGAGGAFSQQFEWPE
jgi:hypothetical protein